MKIKIITLLCLFIFFSCENDNHVTSCFKEDPIEELEWLSKLIETLKLTMMPVTPIICMYDFNNEKYFTLQNGNMIVKIYHCEGDKYCVCEVDSICCNEFVKKAKNKELVWNGNQMPSRK